MARDVTHPLGEYGVARPGAGVGYIQLVHSIR